MRASDRSGAVRRWFTGVVALTLLAGLAVGPAHARDRDRGSGGVIKPVEPLTGCSARLRGDRAQAYWSNVAYQTGEFQVGESQAPTKSVRRAAGTGRLSNHAVGFDGRDAEGLWLTHATIGYDLDSGPLLATRPAYPANTADDASRPGFGVGWSTRPIIGGEENWNAYPYATDAAAYGAYGEEDAVALVRVGAYVVPVDPWTPVSQEGPRETRAVRERLERGRQEWLRERGFVGQVRTFVNDAAVVQRDGSPRQDRPVAKFAGVSKTSDAASPNADAKAAEGEKVKSATEGQAATLTEAPGASAVIHVNAAPVTRISMPHRAGLKNAGTRVIVKPEQGTQATDQKVKEDSAD